MVLVAGHVDHRAERTQRACGQTLDEVGGVLVQRDDGAAVRAGLERPVRSVVRAAGLPRQDDDPLAVLALPGVPAGSAVVLSAQAEGVRHGLTERARVGSVGALRVGTLGQLGGPRPFEQDGIGEAFDLLGRDAGRGCDLVDRRATPDSGLDLPWAQLALQLDRDLAEPGHVTPCRGPQLLVGRHRVALATPRVLEDDRAVPGHPHDPQRAHRPDLLLSSPSG
ncbi:hypothetical protein WY02_19295 [Pseudonocardia sp. AL041005-10]|nr:hypothetical protein WY02_19295 [Pseudonocardia sp. AL041005-10]